MAFPYLFPINGRSIRSLKLKCALVREFYGEYVYSIANVTSTPLYYILGAINAAII